MSDLPRTMWTTLILTQEQRDAIGCVAVESARVDNLVEGLIWELLGLEKTQGLVVTTKIQFKAKVEMLNELIKLSDAPAASDFAPLFSDLSDANTKRRLIIHGTWGLPEEQVGRNFLAALLAGHGEFEAHATFPKGNMRPFPASAVMAVAKDFGDLYYRLIEFVIEHRETWSKPNAP